MQTFIKEGESGAALSESALRKGARRPSGGNQLIKFAQCANVRRGVRGWRREAYGRGVRRRPASRALSRPPSLRCAPRTAADGRGRVATHRHWKLTENRHENRPRLNHAPN